MKKLEIALIRTNGGTQMRAELDNELIAEYKEAWIDGAKFPPLDVFFDGATYWLADGFHRLFGAKEAGKIDVAVTLHDGTLRDAVLFAVGANWTNGLRRTHKDKRKAVATLLNDPEWVKWSDRKIADQAGVGNALVSEMRKELFESNSSAASKAKEQPRIGKDGKTRKPPKPKEEKQVTASESTATVCDHDFDAEACKKCHEPTPTPKITGGTDFNPAEYEPKSTKDALGNETPKDLQVVFGKGEEFDAQRNTLTQVKKWINAIRQHPAGDLIDAGYQRLMTDLDNLDSELKFARPHCVCVYCKNKLPSLANCSACKGRGWITRTVYDQAPKGMKNAKAAS